MNLVPARSGVRRSPRPLAGRDSRWSRRCRAGPTQPPASRPARPVHERPPRADRGRPSSPPHPDVRSDEDAAFVEALARPARLAVHARPTPTSRRWHATAVAHWRSPAANARLAFFERLAAGSTRASRSRWRTPGATRPKRCCSAWRGGRGRAGWPAWRPASGHRVRPLLDSRARAELRDWLRARAEIVAGRPDQ